MDEHAEIRALPDPGPRLQTPPRLPRVSTDKRRLRRPWKRAPGRESRSPATNDGIRLLTAGVKTRGVATTPQLYKRRLRCVLAIARCLLPTLAIARASWS